jgi:molybdopterin-dependent oxidoreductase alpha subunit
MTREKPPEAPSTTPLEPGEPRIEPYSHAAGGLLAVAATTRYIRREAGLVRGARVLLEVNQEDGFDCPSCAWPDPEERAVVEFCENGAKAVADEATTRRVTPAFFADPASSIEALRARSDQWLNAQGRLTHPMILRPGATHYAPLSWDEAFALLGEELRALSSPDEALFYTSGRASNEAAFLYQLFARQLGTNNLPDCSNMCHESSGVGLGEALGTGKGTVTLDDFAHADAIFLIGQNPGTNHPRMLSTLRAARLRGAHIVAVNPLREVGLARFQHPQLASDMLGKGVEIAELHLQVRVGGDVALLQALAKAMLEEEARRPGEVLDRDFIARHTSGFAELEAHLRAQHWTDLVEDSGVPESDLRAAAEIAIRAERTIVCWAMGITQHKHGVANVQEIVNFLLLRGNFGREGAGACPVRGHSNVQGDRTMGVWEHVPSWIDALAREFEFTPPRESGLDTVGAIQAMAEGRARVFFGLGGNFLSATPDTEHVARALARCRLTAHVSTKLNRAHLHTGAIGLILPCLGRTELDEQATGPQFVTVEDSMSVVHPSRGKLPPASPELLSEPAIVARLAHATLGARSKVDWLGLAGDYDRIRDHIARVVPGFDEFNRRVREPGGFTLENPARRLRFDTSTQRARFTVHPRPRFGLAPGELLMTTVRTHDQFNTTVYDVNDRYRGVYGHRRVVLINPDDFGELGVSAGEHVTLVSLWKGVERVARDFVVVAYDLPRRCAATYFPEANALVPWDSFADRSRTPTSKSVVITLRRE